VEESLKEQPVLPERGSPLDARGAQPSGGGGHQVRSAGHVTAGRCEGAARVLDEGAGHEVGTHGAWLQLREGRRVGG
jgi:hypothetical protein